MDLYGVPIPEVMIPASVCEQPQVHMGMKGWATLGGMLHQLHTRALEWPQVWQHQSAGGGVGGQQLACDLTRPAEEIPAYGSLSGTLYAVDLLHALRGT